MHLFSPARPGFPTGIARTKTVKRGVPAEVNVPNSRRVNQFGNTAQYSALIIAGADGGTYDLIFTEGTITLAWNASRQDVQDAIDSILGLDSCYVDYPYFGVMAITFNTVPIDTPTIDGTNLTSTDPEADIEAGFIYLPPQDAQGGYGETIRNLCWWRNDWQDNEPAPAIKEPIPPQGTRFSWQGKFYSNSIRMNQQDNVSEAYPWNAYENAPYWRYAEYAYDLPEYFLLDARLLVDFPITDDSGPQVFTYGEFNRSLFLMRRDDGLIYHDGRFPFPLHYSGQGYFVRWVPVYDLISKTQTVNSTITLNYAPFLDYVSSLTTDPSAYGQTGPPSWHLKIDPSGDKSSYQNTYYTPMILIDPNIYLLGQFNGVYKQIRRMVSPDNPNFTYPMDLGSSALDIEDVGRHTQVFNRLAGWTYGSQDPYGSSNYILTTLGGVWINHTEASIAQYPRATVTPFYH